MTKTHNALLSAEKGANKRATVLPLMEPGMINVCHSLQEAARKATKPQQAPLHHTHCCFTPRHATLCKMNMIDSSSLSTCENDLAPRHPFCKHYQEMTWHIAITIRCEVSFSNPYRFGTKGQIHAGPKTAVSRRITTETVQAIRGSCRQLRDGQAVCHWATRQCLACTHRSRACEPNPKQLCI